MSAPLRFRNKVKKLLPDIGKDCAGARAFLVKPANLSLPARNIPLQHQSPHALGMRFRIGER